MTLRWLAGLLARRRARLIAAAAGVAVAVALIASIGAFLAGSTAAMTDRALARVPLDWQVQADKAASLPQLLRQVRAFPGVRTAQPVLYARTTGYRATANGATSTASAGLVLGVPNGYRATFPRELRQFVGARSGVLIAQQMAANLGVGVGDRVSIGRAGMPNASVRIDGVVDFTAPSQLLLPPATSPATSQAPVPDNVLVVPVARWQALFGTLARTHPELIRGQVHANLSRSALPRDPSAAYSRALGLAKNFETRTAGTAIVGNNLATALDAARGDSLYARVAFLFLGLPGALLAALLTGAIAGAGADRRRRDQALLRARGATSAVLTRLALAESLLVGVVGGAVGLGAAAIIGAVAFSSSSFGATAGASAAWAAISVLVGVAIAMLAIALPAWRDARRLTVAHARTAVRRTGGPWWTGYGLDFLAIAAAIAIYRVTSGGGVQLVLVAEGTTQASVNYWAFLAPMLAWIGVALLSYRLAELTLRRGRGLIARGSRLVSGQLGGTVASSMSQQRSMIARTLTLIALTTCFAATTAAFNATYQPQAEADARLSNGADVVLGATGASGLPASLRSTVAKTPGVASTEPLQHRYAYVGRDLQDVYGVNATSVVKGARLQDSWFAGGTASNLLGKLARTPNGVLLSQEVVHDYQLHPGDRLTMRVLDSRTRKPIPVRFTYVGITKEFPTAPKDAYTIVNAGYLAQATHDPAVSTLLVQTSGSSPAAVGQRIRAAAGTTASVSDIETNRALIASSLTSVELQGLTRIELGFAVVLIAAATGLLLWLGLADRRRTFAIAHALGARSRQLGGFVWTETTFVTAGGVLLGGIAAAGITWMLVKLLTGVFDPPPARAAVPWQYLAELGAIALLAVVAAGISTLRSLDRPPLETLRDL
ncbi:MAG: putative transport system permease protein [Gaiellales bacterium]|nr:putative transport system permease protein [Gaiellales bacterium]